LRLNNVKGKIPLKREGAMKKMILSIGVVLLLGATVSDSPFINLSKILSGSATWQLEELTGALKQNSTAPYSATGMGSSTGSGYCTCNETANQPELSVIVIEAGNPLQQVQTENSNQGGTHE
jgi:hypothetical protein